MFREHFQTGDALAEYALGLKIRPKSPLLLASSAWMHLQERRAGKAREYAQRALKGNPFEPRAHLVLAEMDTWEENYSSAEEHLKKVLEKSPADLLVMARLVGLYTQSKQFQKAHEVTQACYAINPNFAGLEMVLGDRSSALRSFKPALNHYTAALAKDPQCDGCFLKRGAIRFQAGDLILAREDLEKARYLNPFLVKAVNYLKILDRFEHFQHSSLKFGTLALSPYGTSQAKAYYGRALNSIMQALQTRLNHQADEPFRVEVFANQDWMNARALGLGIEFGAGFSFGRCLTFYSEDTKQQQQGWKRIMLHELVHSMNQSRTGDLITPFWFTEGLATYLEGPRRSFDDGLLRGAAYIGELSSLQELIRWPYGGPKFYLHYLQAAIAMRWLIDHMGSEDFNFFLDGFARGESSEQILMRLFGKTMPQIGALYANFLEKHVASLTADYIFSFPPKKLLKQSREGDLQARQKLAMVAALTGEPERLRTLCPDPAAGECARANARAHFAQQSPQARAVLQEASLKFPQDTGILRELGLVELHAGDATSAAISFQKVLSLNPGDRPSAEALAAMYLKSNQFSERRALLESLSRRETDSSWASWQLGLEARRAGDTQAAIEAWSHAVSIHAYHPILFLELARAKAEAGDFSGAREAYASFVGVSRVGLGPARLGAPLPAAQVPPRAPPSNAFQRLPETLPLVSLSDRERTPSSLAKQLALEPQSAYALAGMTDALGRELSEWGDAAAPDALEALKEALHGIYGARAARSAAVALGFHRVPEAAGFLLAARQIQGEEGPFGKGTCADAAEKALAALTGTTQAASSEWWKKWSDQSADEWFRASLKQRGYPPAPATPDGEATLMTIVLEDEKWFRAFAARKRLSQLLGSHAGRGGFQGESYQDPQLAEVREQARKIFKRILKERAHARRSPNR